MEERPLMAHTHTVRLHRFRHIRSRGGSGVPMPGPGFPRRGGDSRPSTIKADPLAAGIIDVKRDEYTQAADEAPDAC